MSRTSRKKSTKRGRNNTRVVQAAHRFIQVTQGPTTSVYMLKVGRVPKKVRCEHGVDLRKRNFRYGRTFTEIANAKKTMRRSNYGVQRITCR